MSKIIPGKFEHFEFLELREQEQKTFNYDETSLAKIKAMVDCSISGTFIHDGVMLAIMGYYELWPGVVEVWVFPSKHIPKYKFTYLKCVKQYIHSLFDGLPIHRMQTSAINDKLHEAWMDFLGFKKEGTMERYSADKIDYAIWARTKG